MSVLDNNLKKIHDAKLISAMLLSEKEKHHPIFAWRIIGDKKVMAQVQVDLVLSARGEFRITPLPEAREAFGHVLGGCSTVNLFFSNSSSLLQTSLKGANGDYGAVLAIPEFIVQMERRKWPRISGENHARVRIQFARKMTVPHPMSHFFSKALSDLSGGGVAFVVTRQELRFLTPGEEVKGLELLIEGNKIKVCAKVIRVQELKRLGNFMPSQLKSYRVSIQFTEIDRKDQEDLAKFIFQNMPPSHQAV